VKITTASTDSSKTKPYVSLLSEVYELMGPMQIAGFLSLFFIAWFCATMIVDFLDLQATYYEMYLMYIIIGGAMALVAAFSSAKIYSSMKNLEKWEGRYLKFAHFSEFDFSDEEVKGNAQDIVARLSRIYPALGRKINKKPGIVEYDAQIDGKKGSYFFDAFIDNNGEATIVRKILTKGNEVSAQEVQEYIDAIKDVVKKNNLIPREFVAFSSTKFSYGAVETAGRDDNGIKGKGDREAQWIILIEETLLGYRVTQMRY
jgi:hypothetical protein